MATCLAGNTARAISSTWQHTCAAKGMMMRGKFAGFAFWLWVLLWNRLYTTVWYIFLPGKKTSTKSRDDIKIRHKTTHKDTQNEKILFESPEQMKPASS